MKHWIRWMTLSAVLVGGTMFGAETPAKEAEASAKAQARPRKGKETESFSPEEVQKRRKAMIEKRDSKLKELREKKTAGTITEKEQALLSRMERATQPGRRPVPPKKETTDK